MGPDQLSSLIPFSGLDYSGTAITGISGSAIGGVGGTDSATVSAIASAYAESAASSKVDQSAFDNCCSSMSAYVSAIQQDTANISATVSGITGGGGGGPVYHDATMTGSGLSSNPLGVKQMRLDFNSAFTQTVVGNTATIGLDTAYSMPVLIVSTPGEATASNVIYVVTGTP